MAFVRPSIVRFAGCVVAGSLLFVASLQSRNLAPSRPLTLDDAVQIALRQNPLILHAIQEVERTEGAVIEARSAALPRIVLLGNYQKQSESLVSMGGQRMSSPSPTPTPTPTPSPTPTATPSATPMATEAPLVELPQINNTTWQITLQATQTIYAGGRIKAAIKMARLQDNQAIFKLRDTVDTVIATVRQQFYLVLLNKALIEVQTESVELLQAQLKDQKERFEAGTVPSFNVLQAEVALANAIPNLIQAKNNYYLAQLELAKTLGYETRSLFGRQEIFQVIGTLDTPIVTVSLADALQQARERRPSLKAQRQNILIEMQDIIIQQAGYKPTLQAQAGWVVQNDLYSKSSTDVVTGWYFGVQGSWALFDGFQTHGRVKQARAKLEQAHALYNDAVAQVDLEVQQAYSNLCQATETVNSQVKSIAQAQEALRMARERLHAGVGTQLDVLNATVALTQTRITTLQARYQYLAALAEFQRATASATKWNETFEDPLVTRKKQKRLR